LNGIAHALIGRRLAQEYVDTADLGESGQGAVQCKDRDIVALSIRALRVRVMGAKQKNKRNHAGQYHV
jgi:hypothetical protein